MSVDVVRSHLSKYGLITKDPVALTEARVLGLRVTRNRLDEYHWQRDSQIPVVNNDISKRELFSITGKLLGHYPVAGWLRVACSYIKRLAGEGNWDDVILSNVTAMLNEVLS